MYYVMEEKVVTVTISARLPEELVKAVDDERQRLQFVPTRTEVVESLLKDWVKKRRDERIGEVRYDVRSL